MIQLKIKLAVLLLFKHNFSYVFTIQRSAAVAVIYSPGQMPSRSSYLCGSYAVECRFVVRVRSRAQVSQSISQRVEHCRDTKSQISFPEFVFTLEDGALHMNLISIILLQLLFFGQTQGKHFLVEVAGNTSLQEGHHGNKGNGETGDYYYGNSYV